MKSLALLLLLCACVAAPSAAPDLSAERAAPVSWRAVDCPQCPPDLDQALVEEGAGHWLRAEQLYAEAVQSDPRCDRALLGRARSLLAQGRAGEAADVLAAGSAGRATAARFDGARACALHVAGRHAEVVALVARAGVGALPEDALVAIGRSALLAGEYELAGKALSRLVALQPADGGAWLDLARSLYLLQEDAPGLYALRQASALGADLGGLRPLVDASGR